MGDRDAKTGPAGSWRAVVGVLAATLVALVAAATLPASGLALVVTVGTPTAGFGDGMSLTSCSSCTQFQVTAPGYTLAMPSDGHITTWRVAGRGPLALRVLRPTTGGLVAVTTSPASSISGVASFPVDIPVLAGDQIAVNLLPTGSKTPAQLRFAPMPTATYGQAQPAVADGGLVSAGSSASGVLSLNADVAIGPLAAGIDVASGSTAGGTAVTITGAYLDGTTSVLFGGAPAGFTISPAGQLLVKTPPRAGPGPVDVVVAGPGGNSTLHAAFTYLTPTPASSTPGSAGSQGTAGGPPGGRLQLLELALAPGAFVAARSGPSLGASATGTRLSYFLSAAATTRFAVLQLVPGRQVPGRGGQGIYCHPARLPVPVVARCSTYVALTPGFSHRDPFGESVLRFTGRLGSRALAPGAYRLTATATDAQGDRSATMTHAFRILAPARR